MLRFPENAECEADRCLDCSAACENCVDVCPNRANVAVNVPNVGHQIIHVDMMCNECGNCTTFCPWSSSPYKDKFTIFANEKDFSDSENNGFLPLADGGFRIRLNNEVFDDANECSKLPSELAALIKAASEQLPVGR